MFKLIAGREREKGGERCAGWTKLTYDERESGTLRCQFISLYQQNYSMLIEAQVRRELFSAVVVSVSANFCRLIIRSIKDWNPGAMPGLHGTPDEEVKERHWQIHQNLASSPGSSIYIKSRAELRWGEVRCKKSVSTVESFDPGVNGEHTFPSHTKAQT